MCYFLTFTLVSFKQLTKEANFCNLTIYFLLIVFAGSNCRQAWECKKHCTAEHGWHNLIKIHNAPFYHCLPPKIKKMQVYLTTKFVWHVNESLFFEGSTFFILFFSFWFYLKDFFFTLNQNQISFPCQLGVLRPNKVKQRF